MKMKITDLPEFMLIKIRKYCYFDDYLCLMNCAKAAFYYIKRNTVFYCLTPDASKQFVRDSAFQQRIYQIVNDPRKQIKLKIVPIRGEEEEIEFPPYPLPVQYLIYNEEADINENSNLYLTFAAVEKVSRFSSSTIRSLSTWPYLRVISFYHCLLLDDLSALIESPNLETVKLVSCPNLRDITPIANISKVVVINCAAIEDYSMFGNQRTLEITGVTHPLDVSGFRKVKKLILRDNANILHYSELCNIHELVIKNCPSIQDLRPLRGKHHSITLIGSFFMSDPGYEILSGINDIKLKNCKIANNDLIFMQNAHSISLNNCHLIDDVSCLSKVKRLEVVNCSNVRSLVALDKVRQLRLECNHMYLPVYGTQIWPELHTLTIKGTWLRTTGIEVFANIRNLSIHNFARIEGLLERLDEWFPRLRSIMIQDCLFLRDAKGLENISEVIIDDCRTFVSVEGLGGEKNHRIKLSRCPCLLDVSPLAHVPIVIISGCENIQDISAFSHHDRFRISYS